MDAVSAFFILGMFAALVMSRIEFPDALYISCVLVLLIAIGLKGGAALQSHSSTALLSMSLAVIGLGVVITLIAYLILRAGGGWNKLDSALVSAHYGSVSFGTYAVGVALLDSTAIDYEAWFPLFVVLLEIPAILVGLMLAKGRSMLGSVKKTAHELFLNPGVLLMVGGMAIGWVGGSSGEKIAPLFDELFYGVLALFLLRMGMVAGEYLKNLGQQSLFMISFGTVMPLTGAALGGALGMLLGLSVGGNFLLAVLGASASYIAVPAAMSTALPNAKLGVAMSCSLGISFPFNVIVGIPLYLAVIQQVAGGGS